jgi:hemolysin activation/secretion protein
LTLTGNDEVRAFQSGRQACDRGYLLRTGPQYGSPSGG